MCYLQYLAILVILVCTKKSNTPQYSQSICSTGQSRADVGSTPGMLCNVPLVQYRALAMVFLVVVLVLEVVHIVLLVHSGADLQWFLQ